MKKSLFTIMFSILLLNLVTIKNAFAHFHYEAEITTLLKTNQGKHLSALEISWVYDPEVSGIMLKDNDDLKSFAKGLIKDLSELGYFTKITVNGTIIETSPVESYLLEAIKEKDQTYLKLSLTVPLKVPLLLKGKNKIILDHTDPSGSATIYYHSVNSITFDKILDPHCIADLKENKDVEHGETPQTVTIFCEKV